MARCFPLVVALSLVGCVAEEPGEEVGRRAAALTPVTWTAVVGASASGNDLVKTAPETAFNAGAVSVQTLAGDGFVEFTTAETTTDKIAGLSVGNGGQGLADIDFGIRLNASGRASVWEGGVNRGGIGPYAAGDVFRVQAEDGVVTYYRNGILRYTSSLAPSFPLLVDTSLRTPGATITDVAIDPIDFWTAAVGVAVDGNDITKTAPEDTFNAGAISLASIPSGDGYVEFRVADNTTLKAAGLSNGNSNTTRNDIDFAISLTATGAVQVYELGALVGNFGVYEAGDVFRVQVVGGVVSYLHNRVVFYTSDIAPTYPLLLDSTIRSPGASILDGKLVAGYVTDECAPQLDTLAAPGIYAIAAAGDLLVVGQRSATPPVATVYRQVDGEWTFEQTLSNPVPASEFAARVATDGETIAVGIGGVQGAPGSVQVYRQDGGGTWVEDIRIDACPGGQSGLFEFAVRGDVLAAAESFDDRVYVYRRVDGAWGLDGILTPTGGSSSPNFGGALAVGGDRVFVHASADAPTGSIYVFRHNPAAPEPPEPPSCAAMNPGKWRQRARLLPPADHLYTGVATDRNGTRILTSDPDDAHLLEVSGGDWTETARLVPYPNSGVGGGLTFGGPGPDDASVALVGQAVFAELDDGWTQIDLLDLPGAAAVAATSAVFHRVTGGVAVFGLDPVCLAE